MKCFDLYDFGEKDYYPFGMGMPGRTWSVGSSEEYRFGFSGKENDDAIKGDDNNLDFGARIYDPRLGKWLTTDPHQTNYPFLSPYVGIGNNPILFVDADGKDLYIYGESEADLIQAMVDIQEMLPCGEQNRATFQKIDGTNLYKVIFDETAAAGPPMDGTNSGAELLSNLVNAKENYLYAVSDNAEYTTAKGTKVETRYLPNSKTGAGAGSSTKKWPERSYELTADNKMKDGLTQEGSRFGWSTPVDMNGIHFDGSVTITRNGYWEWEGVLIDRQYYVFHELWENWERTSEKRPYEIPLYDGKGEAIPIYMQRDYQWDASKADYGAHDISYEKSKKLWKKESQGANLGTGGYATFHSTKTE